MQNKLLTCCQVIAIKPHINYRVIICVDLFHFKYIPNALNECCFCDLYLMTIILAIVLVDY